MENDPQLTNDSLPPVRGECLSQWNILNLKQALRKFSETAKGWYWNMGKLYKKYAVKLEIMLSELKMSGKWQTFWLLLIYLKQSTEQKGHFIKLWYLKWKGVDRDRTLHLLDWNWTADLILSSDWSVSLKLCSDWLGELLTDEFQLLWQSDRQINRHIRL